ncbi:MAG TPA: hypothetical protein VE844_03815, partial [Gammaproteobacteria bacterium]|nr:hypothetical protein [Gammaproteobacteria bacterium]
RERGYLILDDTVIPKPFATAMESLAWVYSSRERKPVYGFARVWCINPPGDLDTPRAERHALTFITPLTNGKEHDGAP